MPIACSTSAWSRILRRVSEREISTQLGGSSCTEEDVVRSPTRGEKVRNEKAPPVGRVPRRAAPRSGGERAGGSARAEVPALRVPDRPARRRRGGSALLVGDRRSARGRGAERVRDRGRRRPRRIPRAEEEVGK